MGKEPQVQGHRTEPRLNLKKENKREKNCGRERQKWNFSKGHKAKGGGERPHSKKGLEHKKRGVRERTPRFVWGVQGLKSETQTELELAHAVRGVGRSISFDGRDLAGVAAAVHAGVALRRAEAEHRVVEHVVSVKAELGFDPFRKVEALRQRHIGEEGVRAAERIAMHVADVAASGKGERTGRWTRPYASVLTGEVRR